MSLSKRDTLKRKCDQAAQAFEKGANYLLELRAIYHPNYPEYVELLDGLLTMSTLTIDHVRGFRERI